MTNKVCFALLATALAVSTQSAAAEMASYTVTSAAQLAALLPSLTQSSEVRLAPGNYGNLYLRNLNPAADVVIRSAELTNKAVIRSLVVRDSSRLRFDQIVFERIRTATEPSSIVGVHVQSSDRIRFTRNLFTGSDDSNPNNDGMLLRFTTASNVVVVDNMFREGNVAFIASTVTSGIFASNRFSQLREGMNIVSSKDILIDRNLFTNIFPNLAAGDHADCIQLFQSSTGTVSHNVRIANNAMMVSNSLSQGILVRNSSAADPLTVQRYTGLTIENNLYVGNVRNGITVADAVSPRLVRNTVVAAASPTLWPGLTVRSVEAAMVEQNVTPMALVIDATATLTNNVLTQHPKALGQTPVAAVLVDPTSTSPNPLAFTTLSGGAAQLAGSGYLPAPETGGIADVDTEARYAWYLANFMQLTQPAL